MHEDTHGEQRFGATAQASEWDTRYNERDGVMWSGRPNGRLVAEAPYTRQRVGSAGP